MHQLYHVDGILITEIEHKHHLEREFDPKESRPGVYSIKASQKRQRTALNQVLVFVSQGLVKNKTTN